MFFSFISTYRVFPQIPLEEPTGGALVACAAWRAPTGASHCVAAEGTARTPLTAVHAEGA